MIKMNDKEKTKELNIARNNIDLIDDEIISLIDKRVKEVKKIGDIKNSQNSVIYRPQRELEILNRLNKKSKYLNFLQIQAIFYEIFSFSRNYEKTQTISFLGPEYSYTHQASMSKFSSSSEYISAISIKKVFTNIIQGISHYGVVPIENSSNGVVSETLSFLNEFDMNIVSEVVLDIKHIIAGNISSINDTKNIYSKDIAFSQCSIFLNENNLSSDGKCFEVNSTSIAAKLASENKNTLAICSKYAAKFYNLPIIYDDIQDVKNNKTRFFIIEKNNSSYEKYDKNIKYKTSILFQTSNKSGSLFNFLKSFNDENINLIKIKSHIYQGVTLFFAEMSIHRDNKKFQKVFKKHKKEIKILGSFIKDVDEI
jgi:chorismate mutase/prephenate dehydratase